MQNGSVFRLRTGSFRKAFKNCEFVFPDAPHPPSEIVFKPAATDDPASAGIARILCCVRLVHGSLMRN